MKTVIIDDKEVKVHDRFEYYQPNDKMKKTGDCVIRALCKATGLTWRKAYVFAFESTLDAQTMPNIDDGEKILYEKLGYKWHCHNNRKARPTVDQFAEQHPEGTYILKLSRHHVCVSDGSYFDSWDSGNRKMYGYWEKPAEAKEPEISNAINL